MAFSDEMTNIGNTLQTASPILSISPSTAIITLTNAVPGASAVGTIAVSNVGTVGVSYYVTADWIPSPGTTQPAARRLAQSVSAAVTASSPAVTLFTGPLVSLIDQPTAGRPLASAGAEPVAITLSLPTTMGYVYQGLALSITFDFVAIAG